MPLVRYPAAGLVLGIADADTVEVVDFIRDWFGRSQDRSGDRYREYAAALYPLFRHGLAHPIKKEPKPNKQRRPEAGIKYLDIDTGKPDQLARLVLASDDAAPSWPA